MTHDGVSIARAVRRRDSLRPVDFSTVLFAGLSAGVFLILLGCVVTAAILFSQGI